MKEEIQKHLMFIFQLLLTEGKIIIPEKNIIDSWKLILDEWVKDESMTLFVRKGGEIRGKKINKFPGRLITTTDNTPAHWVFKKMVFDKTIFTKTQIAELINTNSFPISFIRKKDEYETLVGKMVADKTTRLNEQGWKLAHIEGIAMKRGNGITIEHHMTHHLNFLNLANMYLIDKQFSGLAEVKLFNEIISNYKVNRI